KGNPNVNYSALVPKMKGLALALEAGIDGACVFMSASETLNTKNINQSIKETYSVLGAVIREAKQAGKHVTRYVSTVFDCPYERSISPEEVVRVCEQLFDYGVDDLSLGDTIGTAVPSQVSELLDAVLARFPEEKIIM